MNRWISLFLAPLAISLPCAFGGNAWGNTVEYTVTDLGTLGGDGSKATGINDSGQVVGDSNLTPALSPARLFSIATGPCKASDIHLELAIHRPAPRTASIPGPGGGLGHHA